MSTIRRISAGLRRWKNEDMACHSVGTDLVEPQKGLRRLRGHRDMPKLVAALSAPGSRSAVPVDGDHAIRHAG